MDDDLAAGARATLAAAGYRHVEVICADGAVGHPVHGPYDRIIVTADAWDLPAAWWQQLAVGGRLVVPLSLHGSGLARSVALDLHHGDRMAGWSRAETVPAAVRDLPHRRVPRRRDGETRLAASDQPRPSAHPRRNRHHRLPAAHGLVRSGHIPGGCRDRRKEDQSRSPHRPW
ncbi:MAG: hypothetical protein ACRDTF_12355 [Pseudonocardiaceae bacterium]